MWPPTVQWDDIITNLAAFFGTNYGAGLVLTLTALALFVRLAHAIRNATE